MDPAGLLCIVMELMDQSLYAYLHEGNNEHPWTLPEGEPLLWKTIWNILTQITHALIFMHRKKIVHADLKSKNILLEFSPHLL